MMNWNPETVGLITCITRAWLFNVKVMNDEIF